MRFMGDVTKTKNSKQGGGISPLAGLAGCEGSLSWGNRDNDLLTAFRCDGLGVLYAGRSSMVW